MTKYLRVKNWEQFQHYKDRNPPWIKLHRDLLRDYEFQCLQDASKLQLMLIWLLASQLDNKIPADENFLKNQLGIKGNLDLKELIDKGYLVDDSNALADCKQSAMLETETETETEAEAEKKAKVSLDDLSISHIQPWLDKKRKDGYYKNIDEVALLEYFKNWAANGKPKKDYVATFRNAFAWQDIEKRCPVKKEQYTKSFEELKQELELWK
jgi:hypothetical protein